MHHNLKTLSILSIIILFAFSAKKSFAQYPGMGAVRANMNSQFQNQQMTMQMGMTNVRYDNNSSALLPHTYIVTMADGSKKEVDSKIFLDTILHKNYLVFVDRNLKRSDTNRFKKIYPSQTISIARNLQIVDANVVHKNFASPQPVYFTGKAADSCWMFKVIEGPINVYSFLSEEIGAPYFAPESIMGIQLNNGPVVSFSEANLKQMVGQDINALECIQKQNYLKAIKLYNRDMNSAATAER
jgi:hypothetical protein